MKNICTKPISEMTLQEFKNNVHKCVWNQKYNPKIDSSNRTYISYYIAENKRREISLHNIKSRKEAIEYAFNYEHNINTQANDTATKI